jgi:hypothetical protein
VCGENIGKRTVYKAPLPNRIYCPHCRTRLRYGGTNGPVGLAVILVVLLVVACLGVYFAVGERDPLPAAAFVVFVAGAVLIEVVFVAVLWYGGYALEPVDRPGVYKDEEF